jgi:hypothetical protein
MNLNINKNKKKTYTESIKVQKKEQSRHDLSIFSNDSSTFRTCSVTKLARKQEVNKLKAPLISKPGDDPISLVNQRIKLLGST